MAKTTSSYWANLPSFLDHLQYSTNIAWPLSNLCGPYLYLHQLVETPPNMIPISPHQLRNLPNILKIRKQTSLHYLYISMLHQFTLWLWMWNLSHIIHDWQTIISK